MFVLFYGIAQPNCAAAIRLHRLKLERRNLALHRQTVKHGSHAGAAVNARADQDADLVQQSVSEETGVDMSAADHCRALDAEHV